MTEIIIWPEGGRGGRGGITLCGLVKILSTLSSAGRNEEQSFLNLKYTNILRITSFHVGGPGEKVSVLLDICI